MAERFTSAWARLLTANEIETMSRDDIIRVGEISTLSRDFLSHQKTAFNKRAEALGLSKRVR